MGSESGIYSGHLFIVQRQDPSVSYSVPRECEVFHSGCQVQVLFLACCKHWTLIPEAFSDGSFFPWLPIVSTQRSANQYSADSSRGTFHHLWRPFSVQLSSLVLCPENPHVFIPHMLNSISLTQGLLHAHFLCHSLETLRASSTLVQSHSPCLFPLSQNYCPLLLNVLYPENYLSHEYFAFLLVIFGGRVILVSVILSCLVHSFKSQIVLRVCSLKQNQKNISLPSSSLSSGSYPGAVYFKSQSCFSALCSRICPLKLVYFSKLKC